MTSWKTHPPRLWISKTCKRLRRYLLHNFKQLSTYLADLSTFFYSSSYIANIKEELHDPTRKNTLPFVSNGPLLWKVWKTYPPRWWITFTLRLICVDKSRNTAYLCGKCGKLIHHDCG